MGVYHLTKMSILTTFCGSFIWRKKNDSICLTFFTVLRLLWTCSPIADRAIYNFGATDWFFFSLFFVCFCLFLLCRNDSFYGNWIYQRQPNDRPNVCSSLTFMLSEMQCLMSYVYCSLFVCFVRALFTGASLEQCTIIRAMQCAQF